MESRFGHDFGRVRVHDDDAAARTAEAAGARAYAVAPDLVFGAGEYRPGTSEGRRLLAHELAHVIQQERHSGASTRLRRQPRPQPQGGARPAAPRRRTAGSAPTLEVLPSPSPSPCACIVFIHNNERNARLTARLMHQNCSYNLAIIAPDTRARRIRLPRHGGTVDPNELFTRDVAEQCLDDPQPCRDFLTANAGSTDPAVIEGFAQRQFFLAIRDCSNAFTLPVVALHNNTIDDTARYRARQGGVPSADVQRGTFESTQRPPAAGTDPAANPSRPLQELRDWLTQNFDRQTTTQLTGRAGTTNIFRWCVSPDISRCHVGDPAHPDTVVWVTNEADFNRLSRQNVNVVLQSAVSATGESATDLSSLFIVLAEIMEGRFAPVLQQLMQGAEVEVGRIRALVRELEQMRAFNDLTLPNTLPRLAEILVTVVRLLLRLLEVAAARGAQTIRLQRLRYVNIETPGSPTRPGQTEAQLREENYGAIVATLTAVGLHCCGDNPAAAEARVREELRTGEETAP